MSFSGVPGAKGQPSNEPLQGPSMNTITWVTTATPKVDYAMGNPLQDTSPAEMKPQSSNDSQDGPMTPTANELNGGRDVFGLMKGD